METTTIKLNYKYKELLLNISMETTLGKRRVQAIQGSHFVNLPKFWTKYIGVEKGDQLRIDLLNDGSLRISAMDD